MLNNEQNIVKMAKAVIATEAEAVKQLENRIDNNFISAHDILVQCQGRIVVMGIGKSGHIANKIAATLASTGSPAFFIHPAEASHGDLGMITGDDVIIVISYSGESQEITAIMPMIKLLNIPIISMTGNDQSTIASFANVNLNTSVEKEACPLSLAPTSSTTATLALGDALAITLLSAKGFTAEDFARSHPGGALGKRLLANVEKLMHSAEELPCVNQSQTFIEAIQLISAKRLGHVLVLDNQQQLIGIISDGDIRRAIEKLDGSVQQLSAADVMTKNPLTIDKKRLATEALNCMESKKITALPVVDENNNLIGIIHMHDILRAGIL